MYFPRNDSNVTQTGVTYEVVSNIPKSSEELEDRESLAQLAASGDDLECDGETYIEKYTKGVSAVESILTLDRMRQNVAVKELEQSHGQPMSMRKTASVPNFSQVIFFLGFLYIFGVFFFLIFFIHLGIWALVLD